MNRIFVLACASILLPLQDQTARADPTIDAEGTAYPATISGTGDTVLLVHGMFADNRAWLGLEEAIARGHRFVAYTQRGFGTGGWQDATYSRDRHTEDLAAILEGLDAPADLVGWSYGGAIVLGAAADVPDRVRRVVVYEPFVPELLGGTRRPMRRRKPSGACGDPPTLPSRPATTRRRCARRSKQRTAFLRAASTPGSRRPDDAAGERAHRRAAVERAAADGACLRRTRHAACPDPDHRRRRDAPRLHRDGKGGRGLHPGAETTVIDGAAHEPHWRPGRPWPSGCSASSTPAEPLVGNSSDASP